MVRRVRVDGEPVSRSAAAFGFSRPSFYQAAAAVDADGLAGLVPARPGPRRAHKLTDEVVAFARPAARGGPGAAAGGAGRADRRPVRDHGASRARWSGRWPGRRTPKVATTRDERRRRRDERRRCRRGTSSCAAVRWPATPAGGGRAGGAAAPRGGGLVACLADGPPPSPATASRGAARSRGPGRAASRLVDALAVDGAAPWPRGEPR